MRNQIVFKPAGLKGAEPLRNQIAKSDQAGRAWRHGAFWTCRVHNQIAILFLSRPARLKGAEPNDNMGLIRPFRHLQ